MLIITRKKSQKVIITAADGTEIALQIFNVRSKRVSLGFEAPKSCKIAREEVLRAIQAKEGKQ